MNLSNRPNILSLSDRSEISVIFSSGHKVFTKFGPVYFYRIEKDTCNRAAVLVKKRIGNACYRNYIKRILRFYIRSQITLLGKYNRVIFLYRRIEKTKYDDVKKEYDSKLFKIVSIKDKVS